MLTGADLLARVRELGDVSRTEMVRGCGYVSEKSDGGERINFSAFYEALLEAKGVRLGPVSHPDDPPRKGGRKLSYGTRVQFNGNLMVGRAYTAMLDLKPGDEFEIRLGRNQIKLVPLGGSDQGS